MPAVRPATDADWPAIWAIFREVVAGEDSFAFAPDTPEAVAKAIWVTPPSRGYVAELDGRIAGTSLIRPNAPGLGWHVANAGFMVAELFARRGVGRALGEHALAEAKSLGFSAMQFNHVVATNERAVNLWQSLGFAIVGTVPAAFRHRDHGFVPFHIMHRAL